MNWGGGGGGGGGGEVLVKEICIYQTFLYNGNSWYLSSTHKLPEHSLPSNMQASRDYKTKDTFIP